MVIAAKGDNSFGSAWMLNLHYLIDINPILEKKRRTHQETNVKVLHLLLHLKSVRSHSTISRNTSCYKEHAKQLSTFSNGTNLTT